MIAVHLLALVLLAAVSSGSYIRYQRDIPSGASSGSGSGAFSSASSSSFSSSSGTKVNPGPGGYGNFNAFSGSSNFGNPPPFGGGGGGGGGSMSSFGGGGSQSPFGFPGFNPYVPQYGQQYPYTQFPVAPAPFDFMTFLNQYFQAMQNFQAQAQQAAANGFGVYSIIPDISIWDYSDPQSSILPFLSAGNKGGGGFGMFPTDSNEVGGNAFATYSPQGGYGSASVFPSPEGGALDRFGGDSDTPQNSVGPVGSVSGNFKPPSGSSFGVFTSSSSGSSDVNGKKTSFKQSSVGINDNGKVTTYTAHDP